MKKIAIIVPVGLLLGILTLLTDVEAQIKNEDKKEEVRESIKYTAEDEEYIKKVTEKINERFLEDEDTDKVLIMPDGGYLMSSGTESVNVYDFNGTEYVLAHSYNVETDPNSITVKELKEKMIKEAIEKKEYIDE